MNLQSPISNFESRRARAESRAFTLIEMMITVGLLGFIIVGLVGMFVQTQRAVRVGTTQTDVLAAGRAVMDVITREIEEAGPANLGNTVNFSVTFDAYSTNALPSTTTGRVNVMHDFFHLIKYNQLWFGEGYVIAALTNNVGYVGVGSLYNFQAGAPSSSPVLVSNLWVTFDASASNAINNRLVGNEIGNNSNISTNLHRICDGVVHFRVTAYDTSGVLITNNTVINGVTNILTTANFLGERSYTFTGNAVPAYLELELGLLERGALEKFNSLPTAAAQTYLQRAQTAGRIHIFRRRIPIRNVDPAAY